MLMMIIVWITSQWFQLARVAAIYSGVDVPNTKPCIFSLLGAFVQSDTTITTRQQITSIAPQKYSQLKS